MGKRILAIDDDENILDILNIILGEEGYDLVLLNTGATPQEIRVHHPDLIMLDVRIIGFHQDGSQICTAIKANSDLKQIPVILLSGEPELRQIARECHADSYLNKPFDVKKLVDNVKLLINKT